jgi:toxin secretion/phage lysis holin
MMILIENIRNIIASMEVNLLLYLIVFDIFLGILKAFKLKKLSSCIGLNGLVKHSTIIIIIILFGLWSPVFELEVIYLGLIIFFIVQYLISIVENLNLIGVPLPKMLVDKLYQYDEDNPQWKDVEDAKNKRYKRK